MVSDYIHCTVLLSIVRIAWGKLRKNLSCDRIYRSVRNVFYWNDVLESWRNKELLRRSMELPRLNWSINLFNLLLFENHKSSGHPCRQQTRKRLSSCAFECCDSNLYCFQIDLLAESSAKVRTDDCFTPRSFGRSCSFLSDIDILGHLLCINICHSREQLKLGWKLYGSRYKSRTFLPNLGKRYR